MNIINFPKLEIVSLSETNLQAASIFLFDNWHTCYHKELPSTVTDQRNPDFFRRQLRGKIRTAWLAYLGSRIVGLATVSTNCIDDIWVKPEYQRRRIGKSLLATAIEHIGNRGYSTVQVGLESFNETACHFFQSMGWHYIGSDHIHVENDTWIQALVYSKKI